MRKIRCIVIEDEPIARTILVDYILKVHYLELVQDFENAIEAFPILDKGDIDLIFLDLHLPVIKGFDFLKSVKNRPAVIVTTAYNQYAVEGFELNVVDYLLKPFPFERFLTAVNRLDKLDTVIEGRQLNKQDFIFVTSNKRKMKIYLSSINYVESAKEYVEIFTETSMIRTKMRLSHLYSILLDDGFARPHRSYIVPIKKITSYDQSSVEIAGTHIPIGKIYKESFIARIKVN